MDPRGLEVSRADHARLAYQAEDGVCRHGTHEPEYAGYVGMQKELPTYPTRPFEGAAGGTDLRSDVDLDLGA